MNFFLQAVSVVAFASFVGGTDLQVNAPVSFGLSLSDDILDVITISAMVGIVVVPLVIGLIYAKILITRLRNEMKKKPADDDEIAESFSFPIDVSQTSHSFETRLSDMKTNAVLRLWWKKQHKIHGVTLVEADVEAQRSKTTEKTVLSKDAPKASKSEKTHKHSHSHHKHEDIEKGEKHHKHKKKKDEVTSP